MSNNIKILVVILIPILIVCFLVFNKKEDSSSGGGSGSGSGSNDDDETPTTPAPCVSLGRVEYLAEKQVRRDAIRVAVPGGTYPIGAVELVAQYRSKALAAGKMNTADEILDYAYWAEADKEMKKDGYCFMKV